MVFGAACGSETAEIESASLPPVAPTAPAPAATVSLDEATADDLEMIEAAPAVLVVDSTLGIVGTWRFTSDKFNQYFEDGTWYHARSLHILEYRIDTSGEGSGEYWFEDGLHYATSDACIEAGFAEAGVYEIQVGEDDRVKFVLVEDPCWVRMSWLTRASGRRVTEDEKS